MFWGSSRNTWKAILIFLKKVNEKSFGALSLFNATFGRFERGVFLWTFHHMWDRFKFDEYTCFWMSGKSVLDTMGSNFCEFILFLYKELKIKEFDRKKILELLDLRDKIKKIRWVYVSLNFYVLGPMRVIEDMFEAVLAWQSIWERSNFLLALCLDNVRVQGGELAWYNEY